MEHKINVIFRFIFMLFLFSNTSIAATLHEQMANTTLNANETLAYPNPAQDLVNIHRNIDNLSLDATVTLSDMTGRTLIQENVESYIRDFNLNTEGLHSGMYLIYIKYQNGKSESLKINIIK